MIKKTCTGCTTELQEGKNWSQKGGHKFCYDCFDSRYNKKRMYLGGKYVTTKSQIHKAGTYKNLDDAWSHVELDHKNMAGEVYIITNEAFKGWVKVGMSINAEDRLKSYQTGDPQRAYKLYSRYSTETRHIAEREVHKVLELTFKKSKEWFKADPQEVEWILNQYFGVRYAESQ